MFQIFKRAQLEARRVRWSSSKATWKIFFITVATLIIFAAIIGLFTWGMLAMFSAIRG